MRGRGRRIFSGLGAWVFWVLLAGCGSEGPVGDRGVETRGEAVSQAPVQYPRPALVRVTLRAADAPADWTPEQWTTTRDALLDRIERAELEWTEVALQAGAGTITLQLTEADQERLAALLRPGKMTFHKVARWAPTVAEPEPGSYPEDYRVMPIEAGEMSSDAEVSPFRFVFKEAYIDGDFVESFTVHPMGEGNATVSFLPGSFSFGGLTSPLDPLKEAIHKEGETLEASSFGDARVEVDEVGQIGVLIDGRLMALQAAESEGFSTVTLQGHFTEAEAEALAGALEFPLAIALEVAATEPVPASAQ